MKLLSLFANEINRITDESLREFVYDYLQNYTPDYFWEIGASSSGKYHPALSQGEGGLVRHTKVACLFLEELFRMSYYMYMTDEQKDFCRVAMILHDTVKYGFTDFDKDQYKYHGQNAAIMVNNAWYEHFEENAPWLLLNAIKSHMGQWTEPKEDRPMTNLDRCVHMADYMASRSFIDVPCVTEEYNGFFNEGDLPF